MSSMEELALLRPPETAKYPGGVNEHAKVFADSGAGTKLPKTVRRGGYIDDLEDRMH